jgi:glycerol-3-phosphate dehydrogenase
VTQLEADLLVIGGGATGAGVAWDASLRGYRTILVDRCDLAEGTSGRFHGLLHSGGRYVVKDPRAATECIQENMILRRVAAATIEDTGGLFVSTPADDLSYGDEFLQGCVDAEVPVAEITTAEALRREPRVNPAIRRAFEVPDGAIDAWKVLGALAQGIIEHGGRVLTYHEVTALHRDGDAITGATLRDNRTGEQLDVHAGFTINASGAWAGQISRMAGVDDVTIVPGRGIMIAMNHRLVNTVVNRCTMPADGDILVPIRTVSVIGTTDVAAEHPGDLAIAQDEVDQMLEAGDQLPRYHPCPHAARPP